MYVFIQGLSRCIFSPWLFFTVGEIFGTPGSQPYITRRIPASAIAGGGLHHQHLPGTFSTISQKAGASGGRVAHARGVAGGAALAF